MKANNLSNVEKSLKFLAKRYRTVKYSLGLTILFLMMGVNAFSEDVLSQEVMTNEQIANSKENLKNSVESLQSKINTARKENAKIVQKLLDEGKNVGFLTIGDTMTYSTYVYILEHLPEKYLVETVPGVSSFVDMASRFNFPLMIGDETLKVVSLNKKTNIEFELENNDNIVFMKVSRNFENLKQALIKTGNIDKIIMVSNCGKESQKVYYDIKNLTEDDIPYFTTLIVKKGGFEKWRKFNI